MNVFEMGNLAQSDLLSTFSLSQNLAEYILFFMRIFSPQLLDFYLIRNFRRKKKIRKKKLTNLHYA